MSDIYSVVQEFLDENKKFLSQENIIEIHGYVSEIQKEGFLTEAEKHIKIKNYLNNKSFIVEFPKTNTENDPNQKIKLKDQQQGKNKLSKKYVLIIRITASIIIGSIFSFTFYQYNIFPSIDRIWININKALLGNAWLGFFVGFILTYFLSNTRIFSIKKIQNKVAFGVIIGFVVGLSIGYVFSQKALNRYKIYNGKYKIDTVNGDTWLLTGNSQRKVR